MLLHVTIACKIAHETTALSTNDVVFRRTTPADKCRLTSCPSRMTSEWKVLTEGTNMRFIVRRLSPVQRMIITILTDRHAAGGLLDAIS